MRRRHEQVFSTVCARAEQGLAERALEVAQEFLDKDVSEVLETVQHSTDTAVQTTTEALQVKSTVKQPYARERASVSDG